MKGIARLTIVLIAVFLASAWQVVVAQQPNAEQSDPIAKRSDLYCTGFIAEAPPRGDLQVIGAETENIKATFAQGDVVFLNHGRGAGVQPGAVYYIIRPIGEVKHPFTKKKLGYFVRELGMLRVIEVQDHTSTAEITVSCDTVELGDLLKPYQEFVGPGPRDARPLPRYSEGSGGTKGQIVMAPGYHENLSANRVVFLDLGNDDSVHAGDYFTIYREIGAHEGVTNTPGDNVVNRRSDGYESDRYRGGDISVQATRDLRNNVLAQRPAIPRKVLGELIVLKVEKNSSVAMITRTTSEVNIGDWVERAN
ncbi:MAG TPA: hypothetical protein VNS63_06630 [Blastocatellia bacterium]|nr:hypothetical protein [Blastocatellia bacterium]